jgi:hypothetical protein
MSNAVFTTGSFFYGNLGNISNDVNEFFITIITGIKRRFFLNNMIAQRTEEYPSIFFCKVIDAVNDQFF